MKKEPHISDEEKTKQGHAAFKSFFDQFGNNDAAKQMLLEEFFKVILGVEDDLSVSGGSEQERNEARNSLSGAVPTHKTNERGSSGPAPPLAAGD